MASKNPYIDDLCDRKWMEILWVDGGYDRRSAIDHDNCGGRLRPTMVVMVVVDLCGGGTWWHG